MLDAIKNWFNSRTTWNTIVGAAVVAILHAVGVPTDIVMIIGGLFGLKSVQQASADFGKEANPKTNIAAVEAKK